MKKALSIGRIFVLCVVIPLAILISKHKFEIIDHASLLLNRYTEESAPDTLNITLISDSAYIEHVNITIYSIIKNKSPDTKLHFFVIGAGLSDKEIKEVEKANDPDNNVKVTVLNNKYNFYKLLNIKIHKSHHVSRTDLLRFALPNIFPKLDKILYMDGDTIVQGDLSVLYNTDLKDRYVGAVLDPDRPLANALRLPAYFNNGVLLLNLPYMRKDHISRKMIEDRLLNYLDTFVTQDTFNKILLSRTKFLPSTYNCITALEDTCANATIIHWAGPKKPWNPEKISDEEEKISDKGKKASQNDESTAEESKRAPRRRKKLAHRDIYMRYVEGYLYERGYTSDKK